ncbi:hypothetical protein sos41_18250 [Alphaproteobacteria bacterium SO-S41]|nr:hypothetical protein sos41_18250 [Alphaproteobacteria bacterium SO-S41]
MTPSQIAKRHFEAALAEAAADSQDQEAVARGFLGLVVAAFLERRGLADARAELLAAAENADPDTDYAFMRP